MTWHVSLLWSDWLYLTLLLLLVVFCYYCSRFPHLREPWSQVGRSRIGMATAVILVAYLGITFLDSIHVEWTTGSMATESLLDRMLGSLSRLHEYSYSAPFSHHLLSPTLQVDAEGRAVRVYEHLRHVNEHPRSWIFFMSQALISMFLLSFLLWFWMAILARINQMSFWNFYKKLIRGKTTLAWREALLMVTVLWVLATVAILLSQHFHILGTDKIGRDVFYLTIKSVRTGVLIGTLTTLFMLPFALLLGTIAGYFRGWVDDVVQYIYITLSSIPGVLLITASILVLQVYITNHPLWFDSLAKRADARLLALCLILGVTSWTSLCRLLRGEAMKLRTLEYVEAARVMQISHLKILCRHIVPNTLHIVMITLVLDFSGLVLAEAILSYVGIGVDPGTVSWGNLINSSRLELARAPIVWWPLFAALLSMFVLVLSANLFADCVRDAFDPRQR